MGKDLGGFDKTGLKSIALGRVTGVKDPEKISELIASLSSEKIYKNSNVLATGLTEQVPFSEASLEKVEQSSLATQVMFANKGRDGK